MGWHEVAWWACLLEKTSVLLGEGENGHIDMEDYFRCRVLLTICVSFLKITAGMDVFSGM